MRIVRRTSYVLIILLVAAACGSPEPTPETTETLFLRGGGEVAAIEPGAQAATFNSRGVPSPNWSTVVRTDSVVGGTEVVATDPTTGEVSWTNTLTASVEAKIVSADGNYVAMGPRSEGAYGFGRRTTRLLIVNRDEADPSWIKLEGNYEPEAFATSGKSLFVIRYVPAMRPTRYQVRQLDLTTGEVHGVYTPHGELQQTMGGTARIQASSPDGKRLYTLYTVGNGATQHAFVHVLDLEQEWAHCVDLPAGFGRRAEHASTLTVSPDGGTLYAVNINSGALAAIDTATFQVVAEGDTGFTPGAPHAASDGGTLYVGSGNYVTAFDGADFTRKWGASVPARARGLQVSSDGLYVGLSSEVVSLDLVSGQEKETMDPPGMKKVKQLGPVIQFEEPPPEGPIKCAC